MNKPKENYYLKAFVELADYSLQASKYLEEIITEFNPDNLEEQKKQMHTIEHQADIARHEVLEKLFKEFITIIEREDIISIMRAIDDVTDSVEEIVQRLYMYNIKSLRLETEEFVALIVKCTEALKVLLNEFLYFKKSNKIKNLISDLLRYEEECDRLYLASMHKLFIEEKDPIQLFIWKDLFDRFETCCDLCGHVTAEIESAMFKNL